jgi:hypothetical protein
MHLRELIIACPNTGKELYTGFAMSRQAFEVAKLHDVPVKACPHCREKHVWSIADARLEDSPSAG